MVLAATDSLNWGEKNTEQQKWPKRQRWQEAGTAITCVS